jgi:SAM-dependent methyltransferase
MPSAHAVAQYAATTANLDARIAIHRYGTNPQPWFGWLAQRLPLSGDVLEVGAGTGELWQHADHSAVNLTLTDFSAAMCERLRAVPDARIEQCEAAALPFGDASFDTVIANHMLYHLDDPAAALAEFARVLRPGGRLVAATNGSDHLTDLDEIGEVIGRPDIRVGVRRTFTAQNGPAMVGRFFGGVTVERYPCDLAVASAAPVLAYLDSLDHEPLTSAQRQAARDFLSARIQAQGHFRVRKHTVLIGATR